MCRSASAVVNIAIMVALLELMVDTDHINSRVQGAADAISYCLVIFSWRDWLMWLNSLVQLALCCHGTERIYARPGLIENIYIHSFHAETGQLC